MPPIKQAVIGSAGRDTADGNRIGVAGKAQIADIDIVVPMRGCTRVNAQGGVEIAGAIKERVGTNGGV